MAVFAFVLRYVLRWRRGGWEKGEGIRDGDRGKERGWDEGERGGRLKFGL